MSVPARPAPLFADIDDVAKKLAETGYLPDTATATAVFLADRLGKPLLVEGPAGVGKTELARAVAQCTGSGLVRLQCYEGVDEARATMKALADCGISFASVTDKLLERGLELFAEAMKLREADRHATLIPERRRLAA